MSNEPDCISLKLLVSSEISFNKYLKSIANNLGIFFAEYADALL